MDGMAINKDSFSPIANALKKRHSKKIVKMN